jgi:pyruvate/2-oxoglutarate dehydrogenase complex dihydrolipoamide acyltransferase (E2) component
VLVGLELALALPLGLLLGLAAINVSRVAETVAAGELCDDDGDAEPVRAGEPVGDVDAADDDDDDEPEPALGIDGDGEFGVLLGVLPAAGAVGEADVDDEDDEDGDGVGVGVFVGWGVGVGVGVGVLVAGSASHVVAVFAPGLAEAFALVLAVVVALVEAETLVLGEAAAAAFTVPARAAPGQPASTPRVRNPPASKLSTAARTYARRMNIALSTLLIEVTVCSLWDSEATG